MEENIIVVNDFLIKTVKSGIFTYYKGRDHTNRPYMNMKGNKKMSNLISN